MGVQISDLVTSKEIELIELSGKRLAIDAYNIIYQFLSIIRDRFTGEPLRDSQGRVTSHLSGLFYRISNLLEVGIKPVFVFDGEPPEFKKKTIEERHEAKEEAKKKWEEALAKGEKAITYAQATSQLTDEMANSSKQLLDYMGIPYVQAPSEGEVQCAHMCKKGDVWASASQDYDSLLVGSPRLVRNISVTGKRKLPKKEVYIDVKPEVIELDDVLSSLGIDQKQLIIIGILVGTDYNPDGIKGVGPKKALTLVKEHKSLDKILEKIEWDYEIAAEDIYDFFLNPPITTKYKLEWKELNAEKIIEFMVDEHSFSMDRVKKVIERVQSTNKGIQSSLKGWLEK